MSTESNSSEKPVKVNIGFHGGQTLAIRVPPAELTQLREKLGREGGWYELTAEAGVAVIDLTRIDYVLVDTDSSRIGF
jgi:hypothetical protein